MAAVVAPKSEQYGRNRPKPFLRGGKKGQNRDTDQYGTFLVKLVDFHKSPRRPKLELPKHRRKTPNLEEASAKATAGTTETSMPTKSSPRRSRSPRSPRRTARSPYEPDSYPSYDSRLDRHQQTYVLSPLTLEALRKTMKGTHQTMMSDPNKNIAFHGPRRPLLLSYPTKPTKAGRAIFIHRPASSPRSPQSASADQEQIPVLMTEENIPDTDEARDFVRLAYHLRTGATRTDSPIPKKLRRPKTVAPLQTKAQRLAKEKGFILDGIALSNIQDDYARVQPKLGPAIPPYNSHFDRHVGNYFRFKGVNKTLKNTGQVRERSQSLQGKAVDRFHYIGDGHIYIQKRNRSGAGYSREFVDGHDQFLSEIKPMNSYNGRFGFRRNTPTLRNCPSPFGTASRSPTH
ncbi:uncharacterized protein LOC120343323 [Styela clava]